MNAACEIEQVENESETETANTNGEAPKPDAPKGIYDSHRSTFYCNVPLFYRVSHPKVPNTHQRFVCGAFFLGTPCISLTILTIQDFYHRYTY